MSKIKKLTLPNGLRILLAAQPQSLAASVLILVQAGSEYEAKKINGLSHFLEHMMFKGTANRPQVGQIAEELAALGAQSNAFTGQEYTGYWAKAEAKKLPQILDIVSDLYLNPVFNPEEIEKERGVIIEEINMEEDRLPRRAADLFGSLLYGDQPAGWSVSGGKEIIRALMKEDFLKYRGERYVATGTVVVVAGRFSERAVLAQVRKAFGDLPKRRAPAKAKTVERQTAPCAAARFKDSGQSHLILGCRAFDVFDKRRYALQVLADILGGGMSSRLFKRVREELGAAYYIYANADLSLDHGALTVSAGVEHSKLAIVVRVILEECRRLREEDVPARELQRTKDHMSGSIILGLETADELAGFYGSQEILTKKLVPPEKVIAALQKVTAAEIRAVARDVFRNDRLNVAVVGPVKNTKSLEKILKI
jgi:predicted Zn-dependent peptidase